jgi:M-phase inducer tyrosine phosphatase
MSAASPMLVGCVTTRGIAISHDHIANMFSSSPLVESFPHSRFSSPPPSPTRTDTDFPLDVDQSFNSSMSFPNDSPSLFASPTQKGSSTYPGNDFLSPTPAFGKPRRPDPVPLQRNTSGDLTMRPLGSARMFGRELSSNVAVQRASGTGTATNKGKGMMLPPAVPDGKLPKPRGGIPMQWTSSNEENAPPKLVFQPSLPRREVSCSPRSGLT